MRLIAAILMLVAVSRAGHAQDRMAQFNQVLEKFLEEQRVLLNCSAPDLELHRLAVGSFDDMVKATLELLRTYGRPADVAAFQAKTAHDAVYMRDRKFSEVLDLCSRNEGWQKKLFEFRFLILQNEASRIFHSK